MGLLTLQAIEWEPAACFLAFQTSMMVLTALTLLSGKTDDLYKYEPHTKNISSRSYEICLAGTLLGWGAGMTGALVAGGAQVMCILQLPPMLAATYYHYAGGGKMNMIVNGVFMAAFACLGFVPLPTFQSFEWTPAACFLTFQTTLILLTVLTLFTGKTDDFYKFAPHVKEIMSRHGELQIGSCLLGWAAGNLGALVVGGAQDMCILELPPLLICTYHHLLSWSTGGMCNTIVNSVVMVGFAYFGFVR